MFKKEKNLIIGFILFSFLGIFFISFLFYFISINASFIIDLLGILIILFLVGRNFVLNFRKVEGSFLKRITCSIPKILIILNIIFIIFFVIPFFINRKEFNTFFLVFIVFSFFILVLTVFRLFFRKRSE